MNIALTGVRTDHPGVLYDHRTSDSYGQQVPCTMEEDAALDAEDVLTQAEEANALDPVG